MTLTTVLQGTPPDGQCRASAASPVLTLLTRDAMASGERLSHALQLEAYFQFLSCECEGHGILDSLKASRRLVEDTVEQHLAALDTLLQAAAHSQEMKGAGHD